MPSVGLEKVKMEANFEVLVVDLVFGGYNVCEPPVVACLYAEVEDVKAEPHLGSYVVPFDIIVGQLFFFAVVVRGAAAHPKACGDTSQGVEGPHDDFACEGYGDVVEGNIVDVGVVDHFVAVLGEQKAALEGEVRREPPLPKYTAVVAVACFGSVGAISADGGVVPAAGKPKGVFFVVLCVQAKTQEQAA